MDANVTKWRCIESTALVDIGEIYTGRRDEHDNTWVYIDVPGIGPLQYTIDKFFVEMAPEEPGVAQQHHYKRFAIEPLVFIEANELPFWAGNVVKYVCRHDAKDGLKDLKKARDYLDKKIRHLEGDPEWCR